VYTNCSSYIHTVAKRINETPVGLVDEIKRVIKTRIDEVEQLSEDELEVLITMITSISNGKSAK